MQSIHSPCSFGRIMFEIWKVATEAQFEWFTDSFQEEMQRRIPEGFEAALSVFFVHYVTSMKLDKTKASVQILKNVNVQMHSKVL